MASEEGEVFIRSLAQFIRTHEKALANALQLQQHRARHDTSNRSQPSAAARERMGGASQNTSMNVLAAALSLSTFGFGPPRVKPAKLTLTPHHLFYLLSRFEELGVDIGAMNVRLENLNADSSPSNYVSFLSQPQRNSGRSDRESIHSVSSVRSVMSNMSSFWSNFNIGASSSNDYAKREKAETLLQTDLKYLYSAFTKIPCLRLSPDRRARLIRGYEEFPFDSAVPLVAFKNISVLEICDLDFRTFFGWDRLADQLRSLTIKRGNLDDPVDLLVHVVLDDMDKRRRRSSKAHSPSTPIWPPSPLLKHADLARTASAPNSPLLSETAIATSASPHSSGYLRGDVEIIPSRSRRYTRDKSTSPARGANGRPGSSYRNLKGNGEHMHRTRSGSSNSSSHSLHSRSRSRSSSNLLSMGIVPTTKWRFLRHLCLADNGLALLTASSLSPLANTLQSLDMSFNLFTEVPDCLAILTSLRALDLSNCMINSLHSLGRNPLPAISVLNLRANRLNAIAGVERMLSLERFDIRENRLSDPTEIARLTGIPDLREIWVKGNPFVKSHNNYRITIFNLFRGTPGNNEDIAIDCQGPGYTERRHLRERATEASKATIARPPSVDFDVTLPVEVKKAIMSGEPASHPSLGFRPQPQTVQSEFGVASSKRRRIAKRKIVDLSVEETVTHEPSYMVRNPENVNASASPTNSRGSGLSQSIRTKMSADYLNVSKDRSQSDQKELSPTSQPQSTPIKNELSSPGTSLDPYDEASERLKLSGDAYRQKVQALKDEFGTAWLRVLSEQERERLNEYQQGGSPLTPSSTMTASISNIRPNQSIVGGASTLG